MKIFVFTLILLEVVQGMPAYRMHINTGDISTMDSNPGYSNHFYITSEAASALNTLLQGAVKIFDPNHWEYKKQMVENHFQKKYDQLEKHFQQKYELLAQLGKAENALAENLGNPSLDGKNPKNPGSDIKNPTNPGVDSKNSNNLESDGKNPEFDANNPGLAAENLANPKVDGNKIPSEIKAL